MTKCHLNQECQGLQSTKVYSQQTQELTTIIETLASKTSSTKLQQTMEEEITCDAFPKRKYPNKRTDQVIYIIQKY